MSQLRLGKHIGIVEVNIQHIETDAGILVKLFGVTVLVLRLPHKDQKISMVYAYNIPMSSYLARNN